MREIRETPVPLRIPAERGGVRGQGAMVLFRGHLVGEQSKPAGFVPPPRHTLFQQEEAAVVVVAEET